MKLLKEWECDRYEQMEDEIIKAFSKWRWNNLMLSTANPLESTSNLFGLPYTSTSDFAALWNVQCRAKYKWNPEWKFLCLAYSEDMQMIAVFENEDEDYMYVIIGKGEAK